MFHTKKGILTTIFTFFTFSHISALNVQDASIDPFFGMESTSITTSDNSNTTSENSLNITDYTIQEVNGGVRTSYTDIDREVSVVHWESSQTNDWTHKETPIGQDSHHDYQSSSNTIETSNGSQSSPSQEYDPMEAHRKDSARDSFVEQMDYNRISQSTNTENNHTPSKNAQYDRNYVRAVQWKAYQQLLDQTNNSYDLANKLSSPIVENYLKQLRSDTATKFANEHRRFLDRKKTVPIEQAELIFIDLLISGEIAQLVQQIQNPILSVADAAFTRLKELWPWQRNHTFLTSSHVNGTGEVGFNVRLGMDIIAIAERDLISRPDYIAQHTNPESFKTIQEFREKCISLQQKGDLSALSKENLRLKCCVFQNAKNDDFATNVCYAIAEKIHSDSITNVLYEIVHAQFLEKAHNQLHYLEMQILDQAQQYNIILTDQIKDFIIKQYGFDPIEAAYNCYTSRPDYIKTVNDQPLLSNNNISPILHNIENKPLSTAHKELTHLQKQVIDTLESLNITDKAIQKELIVKKFGIDILEQANNTYKNRYDHKELMNSFIPIDVHNTSINILNSSHDYAVVGQQFDVMAEQVFHNARLCKLDFVENIENHVIDSIHIIKSPQNDAQFVFNVTVVDHLLTDIQHQVNNIVEGKSASYMQYIERGSELFTRAIIKFIEELNPVTQVKNIGELLQGAGHLTSHAIQHPIDSLHTLREINTKTCEFLVSTAIFTSDTIFGTTYLTPEEYQQRNNTFWKTVQSVPAESIVDLVAQVAADFAFGKGFAKIFIYIKELDVATQLENYAAKVADKLKQAVDMHLVDNPILVTAEGVTVKMSNNIPITGGGNKNVIKNTKTLLESTYTRYAIKLEKEIEEIRNFYKLHPKYDVPNFGNKELKIAYEHILGMELKWNDQGNLLKLGGFHHDFMGDIENNNVFKFINKVVKEHGCYSADIIADSMKFEKTFFPQHWSQTNVINKIHEAYNNFIKNGGILKLENDGKYLVHGLTNEGIKIEMHITQKGLIKTAFPIVK